MKDKSEKNLRRSFIVAMFFFSCTVALLYNVQAAQAWNFHPFDVTVTMGKCELIDLTQKKYVTEVADPTHLKWKIEEIPSLLVPLLIPPDPDLLEKGTLKLCLYDTGCQQISINISDSENSTADTVILKLTPLSKLEIVGFPKVFRPYEGSLNPFLKPDEEVDLSLSKYIRDTEYDADQIIWEVSSDRKVWGNSITTPVFDITIDNIGGVAKIRGKQTGNGYAIFRATNPCGLQDKAELLIIVNRSPVINDKCQDIIAFVVDQTYTLDLNKCVSDDQTRTDKIKWRINGVDLNWSRPPVIYEDSCVKVVIDINRIAVFSWKNPDCSPHNLEFIAVDDPITSSDIEGSGAYSFRKTVRLLLCQPLTLNPIVIEQGTTITKELPSSQDQISGWKVVQFDSGALESVTVAGYQLTIKAKENVDKESTVSLTANYCNDPEYPVPITVIVRLCPDIILNPNPTEMESGETRVVSLPQFQDEFPISGWEVAQFDTNVFESITVAGYQLTIKAKKNVGGELTVSLTANYCNDPKYPVKLGVIVSCPDIILNPIEMKPGDTRVVNLPQLSGWQVVVFNTNVFESVTVAGYQLTIKAKENVGGESTVSLTANYCNNPEYSVELMVDVEGPVNNPPEIETEVQEISASGSKPGKLELKVTDDVDTPEITWQTIGNKNTDVITELISHRDNLWIFKATFTVKDAKLCEDEYVTLIASDNHPDDPKEDEVTIHVRVIGPPVITLPEWILLQPGGLPQFFDLTQAVIACDTDISWLPFQNSNCVNATKTGNLLTLDINDNPCAGVEYIAYAATANNLSTVGNIAVIILPQELRFEEDTEGVLTLPTHVNGNPISWTPDAPNNDLDIKIETGKVVVKSKTKDFYGNTIMSLTANVKGESKTVFINAIIEPVCDPPEINRTAILDELSSKFGVAEVVISDNDDYVLRLDDKVTDVDTPTEKITCATEEQYNHVEVKISPDYSFVRFTVKAVGWCGAEDVTLIVSDDCQPPKTAKTTIAVRVISSPVIALPEEWILLQKGRPKSLDLTKAVTACGANISWTFQGSNCVNATKVGNLLTLDINDNPCAGVEYIGYTATANNLSTDGNLAVLILPAQLIFEEDKVGTIDLPTFFVNGNPITWSAAAPNNDLDINIQNNNKALVASNVPDGNGETQMSLIAADVNGKLQDISIDVIITPKHDSPEINGAIWNELIDEFGVKEVVIFANQPYTLNLFDKVTDVDTSISQITWQAQGNQNTEVEINNNSSATFKVKDGTTWCGTDFVELIASDDSQPPNIAKMIVPVRVTDLDLIKLPDWILLQPSSPSLDLTKYTGACNGTVTWEFSGGTNIIPAAGPIMDRLTFTIPPNWSGREKIDYQATNEYKQSISGTLWVIAIPTQLAFNEDDEGLLGLPSSLKGMIVNWMPQPNNHLDITVVGSEARIKSKVEDWYGNTTISFTANSGNQQEIIDVYVTVIPVDDPPEIADAFAQEKVVVSSNKPYVLRLDDKVTDVDTPISQITWQAQGNQNNIEVTISNNHRYATFKLTDPKWSGSEPITFIASDGQGSAQDILVPVAPPPTADGGGEISPPVMPSWMLWNETLFLPSTVMNGQTVTEWGFFRGGHIIPGDSIPPPPNVQQILTFNATNWWGIENVYYKVIYDNGISFSDSLPVIAFQDLESDEDVPIIKSISSSKVDVSLTWDVVDSQHITVTTNSGIITFTPEPDWSGQEKISITITEEGNGKSESFSINVTFNPVDDEPTIEEDEFPTSIRFHTYEKKCLTMKLSDKVYNPDDVTIEWSHNVLDLEPHINVQFVGDKLVQFCIDSPGWTGEQLVELVATIKNKNGTVIDEEEIGITVVVFSDEDDIPTECCLPLPIFKLWNVNSGSWNLSEYIKEPRFKNSIDWDLTPTKNVIINPTGQNSVRFILSPSDWTYDPNQPDDEPTIKWEAQNRDTMETLNGSITIIGMPSSLVTGETLNPPKIFKWAGQDFDLSWRVLEKNCVAVKESTNGFQFDLLSNCTSSGGDVTLRAEGGSYHDTVKIMILPPPAAPSLIQPFRFSLEKGFSVENGEVSLEMSEDSRLKVYLADKIGNSGTDIIAPSLEIPKVIWMAKRSQHIDVQIDNVMQTATFIPDVDWDKIIIGETELVQLMAMDTKTGNSDTIEIKVTVIPTSKPVVIERTALLCNYPNPFNAETWIPYKLSTNSDVKISIYNQTGQLVRTIDLGNREVGSYVTKDKAAYWDGRDHTGENVASGMYFYTLQARRFSETRKMMIVK